MQKDIESPHETRATLANWQQYLTDLMIRIAGSIDDDDRLRRLADLIGFKYFNELMGFFDACRDRPPVGEYKLRKARFLHTITA